MERYTRLLCFLVITMGSVFTVNAAELVREGPPRAEESRVNEPVLVNQANPYLSYLPADIDPQYELWKEKLIADGEALHQGFRKNVSPSDTTLAISQADAQGNVDLSTAFALDDFGSSLGKKRRVEIQGVFESPDGLLPVIESPYSEDNGSVYTANTLAIEGRVGTYVKGALNDAQPSRTDFDFYDMGVLNMGEQFVIETETSECNPELIRFADTYIEVYLVDLDVKTAQLVAEDDFSGCGWASKVSFTTPENGHYFVLVKNWWTPTPDVFSGYTEYLSSDGGGDYILNVTRDSRQTAKVYAVELEAGDVLGVSGLDSDVSALNLYDASETLLIGSTQILPTLFPEASPLRELIGVGAMLVAPEKGTYYIEAIGDAGDTLTVNGLVEPAKLFATNSDNESEAQTIFLDFDGAIVNARDLYDAGRTVSSLSSFKDVMVSLGFDESEEEALVRAIIAVVEENITHDLAEKGNNGRFNVDIQNSIDDVDTFGAENVSRIVIGGNASQLGIFTYGIAEFIDVGNFSTQDTGVVLADALLRDTTSPWYFVLASEDDRQQLIATAFGNVIAHEIGHMIGNFHTDNSNDHHTIMDQGGNFLGLVGAGQDGVFGTEDDEDVDFAADDFSPFEGFTGLVDTLNVAAFGLSDSNVRPQITGSIEVGRNSQVNVPLIFFDDAPEAVSTGETFELASLLSDFILLNTPTLTVDATSGDVPGESMLLIEAQDNNELLTFEIPVLVTNELPVIGVDAIENAGVTKQWVMDRATQVQLSIADADDELEALTVSVQSEDDGIAQQDVSLRVEGGQVIAVITPKSLGSKALSFVVSDGYDSSTVSMVAIVEENEAPEILLAQDTVSLAQGEAASVIVEVTDADNLPESVAVSISSENKQLFTVEKNIDQNGTTKLILDIDTKREGGDTLVIEASDGLKTTTKTLNINVTEPEFTKKPSQLGGSLSLMYLWVLMLFSAVAKFRKSIIVIVAAMASIHASAGDSNRIIGAQNYEVLPYASLGYAHGGDDVYKVKVTQGGYESVAAGEGMLYGLGLTIQNKVDFTMDLYWDIKQARYKFENGSIKLRRNVWGGTLFRNVGANSLGLGLEYHHKPYAEKVHKTSNYQESETLNSGLGITAAYARQVTDAISVKLSATSVSHSGFDASNIALKLRYHW